MTEDEAKRELREYRYDKRIERQKLEQLEEIRNDCMRMSTIFSDMPKAPYSNVHKIEEKYANYIDLQNEVLDLLNSRIIKILQITEKIERLEQPFRSVLELRYSYGKALWEIADELNCGSRTVSRIYDEAIRLYAKL